MASPAPTDRAALLALAAWLQQITTVAQPIEPLMTTPQPTDARWRTALRDAATSLKRAAAERPHGAPPACLAATSAEADRLGAAYTRMADELTAGADTPNQARLDAARRAFDEGSVYLTNATDHLRQSTC